MNVAQQLYRLQEVDLELESNEQTLRQKTSQLGESQKVVSVRAELSSQRQYLEELKRRQHSAEWEVDDLTTKITTLDQKLYGGSIRNPKELTNLQQDVDGLKARRNQWEDTVLEIMDQAELAEGRIATLNDELKRLEAEWHSQQQHLTTDIEQLKTTLSDLEKKRQLVLANIDPWVVNLYQELKRQKGTSVAKVDQGTCHGCRILLPTSELQRVRGGGLIQCSSCGRILFLA
jgi:predicted  nucleic acid-binding Zn-ribbon protein